MPKTSKAKTKRPAKRPAKRPGQDKGRQVRQVGLGQLSGLQDLLKSALPDRPQLEAVQTCLEHVQVLARQLLGETSVVVQGSYAQGLALRSSDLDIAVIRDSEPRVSTRADARGRSRGRSRGSRGHSSRDELQHARFRASEKFKDTFKDRLQARQCLQVLAEALSEAGLEEIRVALKIFSAKVPVLRLHCGAKGQRTVVVDVSVGSSLLRGACDRAVYAVLQKDHVGVAVPLCRLVKLWAKRRKLTNTLKGGLSSFAFVLLTIFFLQQRHPDHGSLPSQSSVTGSKPRPANPEQCCPPPLGLQVRVSEQQLSQILLEFFNWAAEELPKLQNCSISIASASAQPRSGRFKPLVVEVPFSPEENAARCLRVDVWPVICEELSRAQHLAKQIARKSSATLVQRLFSPHSPHSPHSKESEIQPGKEPLRQVLAEREVPRVPERKRKRKMPQLEAVRVKAPVIAPVNRWLGLRTLLDPR